MKETRKRRWSPTKDLLLLLTLPVWVALPGSSMAQAIGGPGKAPPGFDPTTLYEPHPPPEIQAPPENYVDTDGDNTIFLIVKAAPGEVGPDEDPRSWRFKLRFECKEGDAWKMRDVLPYLSVAAVNVAANQKVELEPGTWRVKAQTTSPRRPEGLWSAWRHFSIAGAALGRLGAPTVLAAKRVSGDTVVLTWRDNAEGELGFKIERKGTREAAPGASGGGSLRAPSGRTQYESTASTPRKVTGAGGIPPATLSGGFIPLGTVAPNRTSFTDTGLEADTTYIYRVKAYRGGTSAMGLSESDYSNEATAPAQRAATGATSPERPRLNVKPTKETGPLQKE